MSTGHPSDAERARDALPLLERLVKACCAGDAEAIAACYRDDAVWLDREGAHAGDEAVRRHAALAEDGREWDAPQQQGAKAVLRWRGPGPQEGAVVVEVRRTGVVFAAVA